MESAPKHTTDLTAANNLELLAACAKSAGYETWSIRGDICRAECDLNRQFCPNSMFSEEFPHALEWLHQSRTPVFFDVHSFPGNLSKWRQFELVIMFQSQWSGFYGIAKKLNDMGIITGLVVGTTANYLIVQAANIGIKQSFLLEFNENLTEERSKQIAASLCEIAL
jgi:hypothetical protein